MTKVKNTEEKKIKTFKLLNFSSSAWTKHLHTFLHQSIIPFRVFRGISRKTYWPVQNDGLSECQSSPVHFAMSVSTRNRKLSRASPRVCFGTVDIECHLISWPRVFLRFVVKKTLMPFYFLNPSASVSSSSADDLRPCGHTIEQIKNKEKSENTTNSKWMLWFVTSGPWPE